MASWSLTFSKFNRDHKRNYLTAYQREQDIVSPFQAKQNSSSSPNSTLECPPPLIRWRTPEYGGLKKSIIDNNTFISPYKPTTHPLLPQLDHFQQDSSTSLLSKYRGFWQTNFLQGAVSELQSLKESQAAVATGKTNQNLVKYRNTKLIHERSSQFFSKREKQSRMHSMMAQYKNKVLDIGEQNQALNLQYRHNRMKNDLTRSLEHCCPSTLADGFIKDVPLPSNLQKNEYFIRKCTNEKMKNLGRSSTTTSYNSGVCDRITSSLDENDEYTRLCVQDVYKTNFDKGIPDQRAISFINNRIGIDPHKYGINNDLTLKHLSCSSEGVYDRKSTLAEIDKIFEIFIPTMRTTAISPVFQKDLINLHKNSRLSEIVDPDNIDVPTITGNRSPEKHKMPSAKFMLQPNALLSHFKAVGEAFRKFALMDSIFKDLCPGDQNELLNRNTSLFIMVGQNTWEYVI